MKNLDWWILSFPFRDNIHGLKIPLYYRNKKYLPKIDDIYAKLKLLISDRKALNRLSYNSFKFANSNFTLDNMANKIIKLYNI